MPHVAPSVRPLVAGNWKMNGTRQSLGEAEAVREALGDIPCDVMLCPPATLLGAMATLASGSRLQVGAQDCHDRTSGAFTGDLSAEMLADAGAFAIIVGHSERRTLHSDRDRDVRAKAAAAHRAGLMAIICVGETAGERRAGLTLAVVQRQLAGSLPPTVTPANTVIAYEPVWAIGTGLTPTSSDVAAVHAEMRRLLCEQFGEPGATIRLLYGGSVKAANAHELLNIADVNGALVGGASLLAADFLGILKNAYGV